MSVLAGMMSTREVSHLQAPPRALIKEPGERSVCRMDKHANIHKIILHILYITYIHIWVNTLWSGRCRVNQANAERERKRIMAETKVVAATVLSFHGAISVPAGVTAAADALRRPPAHLKVIAVCNSNIESTLF